MRKVIPVLAITAAALALPISRTAAQSCLGLPTRDGDIAVGGIADLSDGDAAYGAEFGADVSGPAAFRFAYTDMSESDARTFSALASYDFFLVEPAVCGVAGVVYEADPAPGIPHRYGIPVGIGFGKTLSMPRFSATVYALPQYVWVRETDRDALGNEDTKSSNEFRAEAGATVAIFPFYVGGALVVSTVDNRDPAFRIRVGLTF